MVECAMQTMKKLIIANMEDNLCLIECVKRALHVMRFTIHVGVKLTSLELHHIRKLKTEFPNLVKDVETFLSNWSELSVPADSRSKIPIYVSRNSEGKVSNHHVMARTKTKEKPMAEKSPERKTLVSE